MTVQMSRNPWRVSQNPIWAKKSGEMPQIWPFTLRHEHNLCKKKSCMEKCLPRLERCHGSLKGDAAQIRAARRESVRQQCKSNQMIKQNPLSTESICRNRHLNEIILFFPTSEVTSHISDYTGTHITVFLMKWIFVLLQKLKKNLT